MSGDYTKNTERFSAMQPPTKLEQLRTIDIIS